MWSPITIAYDWVHNAAQILENKAGLDGRIVQLCFQALLKAMSACQTWAGSLHSGIVHFLKVTDSYWSGLFHCYSVSSLPRTNNDLEHIFGIVRHHQRRCTGRKVASASLVLRGSVQLVACVTKYKVLNKQRTVNIDNPCCITDPPTHGSLFISDDLLTSTDSNSSLFIPIFTIF